MKYLFIITLSALTLACLVRLFLALAYGPKIADGDTLSYTTIILSEPQQQGNSLRFTSSFANAFGSIPIFVSSPIGQDVKYGDFVRISGKARVRVIGKINPAVTISFARIEAEENGSKNVLAVASFVRQKVTHFYFSTLPASSAALLTGIVLGVKEPFSKDFQQALQTTGLMHVIAASGMNVTLVGAFLLSIFGHLLPRKIALLVTSCALLFYCLLAGLQPSIVRATVMSIMVYSGQFFGRQYSSWYSLLLTGLVMIFISPQLLFDIGFQLSFAATAGILFLRPLFPRLLFTDDLATTVSAQITTLPILLAAFGQYGLLSIFANALVLWTVPFLMVLGGVGALIGIVLPFAGMLFLWIAYPLLLLFQLIVGGLGNLPLVIHISQIPWPFIVGYYLLLISGILFMQRSRQ